MVRKFMIFFVHIYYEIRTDCGLTQRCKLCLILVPMGVVIQEMVDADSAGVVFSRDPVTGNPTQIVITANYGLGEVRTHLFTLFFTLSFEI